MRQLVIPAFAVAVFVLLASFTRTETPAEMLSSVDPSALTAASPSLPSAPITDAH
ncbi:MAG TPA: hypothetical protein VF601_08315 [Beijerinckiaceae bacterium]|jgi:hypothetical protein